MKTQLRLVSHSMLPGANVVEIWYGEQFIGTVAGSDGPGVRVLSKHPVEVVNAAPMITEVRIEPGKLGD
jgi:hypothetical protein